MTRKELEAALFGLPWRWVFCENGLRDRFDDCACCVAPPPEPNNCKCICHTRIEELRAALRKRKNSET